MKEGESPSLLIKHNLYINFNLALHKHSMKNRVLFLCRCGIILLRCYCE